MNKFLKNNYLIILILLLLPFLLLFLALKTPLKKIETKLLVHEIKHYTLEAENNYLFYANYNLVNVETKPGTLNYFYQYFKNETAIKRNIDLFFENQIISISELFKWGNKLQILKTIQNERELENWWQKNKPRYWQFFLFNNFGSWEAVLAKYYELSKYKISTLTKTNLTVKKNECTLLKGFFATNEKNINIIINQLNKEGDKKNYLADLNESIHLALRKKINEESLFSFKKNNWVTYPLDKLISDKEFGHYDIFVDEKTCSLSNISLFVNNSKFLPVKSAETKNKFHYQNIDINSKTQVLYIELPNSNIIRNSKWYKSENNLKNQYRYKLDLIKYIPKQTYLLSAKFTNYDNIIFQLEGKPSENEADRYLFISELFTKKNQHYMNTISFNNGQRFKYLYFVVISPKPISADELNSYNISLFPLCKPELLLVKKNINEPLKLSYEKTKLNMYKITFSALTLDQEKLLKKSFGVFWKIKSQKEIDSKTQLIIIEPIYFWLIKQIFFYFVACFLLYLIWRYKDYFLFFLKNKKLQEFFFNTVLKFNKLFIWIFFFLFFYDLFFLSVTSLIFLTIMLLAYNFIKISSIKIVHIFFFMYALLMIAVIIKNEFVAEKIAMTLANLLLIFISHELIKLIKINV